MNINGTDYLLRYDNGNNAEIASRQTYTVNGNFPEVYTNVSNRSLIHEPVMDYTVYDHYISISSNNRDATSYPLHYDYRINLDYPIKNVRKIEMISAILPNQGAASSSGNILNESHLIIDIDEINYIEFPNNTGSVSGLKGFSILPLKNPTKTTGGFINPELGCIYHKSKVFKTPMANLNHFSIKIRNYQGVLYDFGQANGSTDKEYQNHFVFKITSEEVNRNMLNHRNVY